MSKHAYSLLDDYLWRLACKWADFSHPNKPRRWIVGRYFGKFNTFRNDHWVFGSRDSGAYLLKFAWTKIVRHLMVEGRASPDDPALAGYWQQRRRRDRPRWIPRPGTCCAASAAGARSAGDCSCTPTASPRARRNGSSGTPPRARRSASTRSTA